MDMTLLRGSSLDNAARCPHLHSRHNIKQPIIMISESPPDRTVRRQAAARRSVPAEAGAGHALVGLGHHDTGRNRRVVHYRIQQRHRAQAYALRPALDPNNMLVR